MNDATLSIIIPAHNDATTLEDVVQSCLSLLPRCFADIELIIVDDGSDDATAHLADQLAAAYEPVVVLHQRTWGGYGTVLAHGIGAARGDYIAVLAANTPHSADDLVRLVPVLDRAAVVVGTSQQPAGATPGWFWGGWPRGAEHSPLLVSRAALRGLPLTSRSRLIHPEIAYRARRAGLAVATVALPTAPAPRASFGEIVELLRLRAQIERGQQGKAARRLWQQKALLGGALAALVGGVWVALRRR